MCRLSKKDIKPFNEVVAERLFASLGIITSNSALQASNKEQYNFLQQQKHLTQVHSKSLKQATEDALIEYRSMQLSNYTETANEDSCFVCGLGGFLILCDTCDNSCHLQCANPPLMTVPQGEWFCMKCRNVNHQTPSEQAPRSTAKKRKRRINASKESPSISNANPTNMATTNSNSTTPSEVDQTRPLDPINRIVNKSAYWKTLMDKNPFNEFKELSESKKRSRNGQEEWDSTVTRHQKKQKKNKTVETLLQMIKSAPMDEKKQLFSELKRSVTDAEYDLMLINGEIDYKLEDICDNTEKIHSNSIEKSLRDDDIQYIQDEYTETPAKQTLKVIEKENGQFLKTELCHRELERNKRLERKVKAIELNEKRKRNFASKYDHLRREILQGVLISEPVLHSSQEETQTPPIIRMYDNTPSDKSCREKHGALYIRYRVNHHELNENTSDDYNFMKIFFYKKQNEPTCFIKLSTLFRLLAVDLQLSENRVAKVFEKKVEDGKISWHSLNALEQYKLNPNKYNLMELVVNLL